MRILPCGPRALLLEVDDLAQVSSLLAHLRAARKTGDLYAVDVVPAARTVLVDGLRGATDLADARRVVASWNPVSEASPNVAADLVVLPVVYDGEDLADVAAATGMSVEEVMRRHGEATYDVAFCGFLPGFAYLVGLAAQLQLPRREVPRTRVPAGSVAVAGEYAGVYPREGPGGWHLLGRTDAVLFDVDREPAALLRPGTRVQFEAVAELPTGPEARRSVMSATQRASAGPDTRHRGVGSDTGQRAVGSDIGQRPQDAVSEDRSASAKGRDLPGDGLVVEAAEGLVSVQDRGRPGLAHLAVPASGALDRESLADANRLLGNDPEAAGVEVTGGTLTLRATGHVTVVVTGAPCPVHVDGAPAAWGEPLALSDGQRLELGRPAVQLRSYLGVAGGVAVAPVLGSRSTDLLSGLGPRPMQPGDRLPVGDTAGPVEAVEALPRWTGPADTVLAVHPGPRLDWFDPPTWRLLTSSVWTVTADSNRVGLRLAGPPLERTVRRELPSEGLVTGAVQVPSSGRPLVFLADHPTTGGYPVVAVVDPPHLRRLAQLRPGDQVRLGAARV